MYTALMTFQKKATRSRTPMLHPCLPTIAELAPPLPNNYISGWKTKSDISVSKIAISIFFKKHVDVYARITQFSLQR